MPYYRPTTVRKYNLFEVASCLQKAIRRGDTALAGYMAIEMFESNFALYCWKRLLTVSAEDCSGLITQEVKALYDSWLILTNQGKAKKSRIFISKAVIVLCQARKCRDADHLQNFVHDEMMIDAKQLEAAWKRAAATRRTSNCRTTPSTFTLRRGRRRARPRPTFSVMNFSPFNLGTRASST
jgi:hypothetical protein